MLNIIWYFFSFSIDFPSHFILSVIDVYRDSVTRDKLIFPSAITGILCHFSVPFPLSYHFSIMGAIDVATVKWSKTQFWLRRFGPTAPPTPSAPSTFVSTSSMSGVTLGDIMEQIQCMDAHLDTLSDELCQVNTRVSRIARRQAVMGGFIIASSSSPPTSKDKSDDGSGSDDADEGDSASSPSDDEMST